MESLLRWGIENTSPNDGPPPAPRQDLDPAIIDIILGKSDAELMKEDMAVAVDETQSESARIHALDHLEMLIEQIDNANNIEKLKLWDPLQRLLINAPTPAIQMQVLWVIGTALQNNPAAQDAYFVHNPLPVLTRFLVPSPSSTTQIRSKVIYALSGLLKHNATAVATLSRPDVDGWTHLREALQDPDLAVRRKCIFLLNSLLVPGSHASSSSSSVPIHANSHAASLADPSRSETSVATLTALREQGILDAVVAGLTSPVPTGNDGDVDGSDPDFEEKGLALLHTYAVPCNGKFTAAHKAALAAWIESERKKDPEVVSARWGLSRGEFDALLSKIR
ncbi:armadillo-type protein [Mycena rebaudengoi]|nr:armadillo-type protein [Mycena rebaudengoi]